VESTVLVGRGLAIYLNATKGTAKYTDSHLWVQNAPTDTETIGITYNRGQWNAGLFSKRVGDMWNDNGSIHQAIPIDPFNITNLFFNYTVRGSSRLSQSRVRLALNNLTDSHAITAVSAASAKSNAATAGDILTLMSGRSVSVSLTVGFSPR
jgi:iron complex outermembrane receptor protein